MATSSSSRVPCKCEHSLHAAHHLASPRVLAPPPRHSPLASDTLRYLSSPTMPPAALAIPPPALPAAPLSLPLKTPPPMHHAAPTCSSTDRWHQLRGMVRTLTGLNDAPEVSSRRRRRRCPMLLLHHDFWLEALDTKHRYGFHLRAFYSVWKHEMAGDAAPLADIRDRSFFHWLDHGRGSTLELPDCSRAALNATRVQYCSSHQRQHYHVAFDSFASSTRLLFAHTGLPVDTDGLSKWIFVLARDDSLYIARKRKGRFHHSSFLAGAPIVAAGKIFVANGRLHAIEPHSGHFKPTLRNLVALWDMLTANGVDMETVRLIKPKKWKDPWPFQAPSRSSSLNDDGEEVEIELPLDAFISDSEDS